MGQGKRDFAGEAVGSAEHASPPVLAVRRSHHRPSRSHWSRRWPGYQWWGRTPSL